MAECAADGSEFDVVYKGTSFGRVKWSLLGQHNVQNAMMAIIAARHAGVLPEVAIEALTNFVNAKRRMEVLGTVNGITVYDDFAHHPTAISTTLEGLRAKVGKARILAVLEPRSNTMKMGVHKQTLAQSWSAADQVFIYQPSHLSWSMDALLAQSEVTTSLHDDLEILEKSILSYAKPGDHILIMSNGGFGGIHQHLLQKLSQ